MSDQQADNPYRPPAAEVEPQQMRDDRARPPMPGRIIAVIVLVSIYLLFSLLGALANPVAALVRVGIGALILVGLIRGHALAWQWGMIMPILAALGPLVGLLAAIGGGLGPTELLILLLILALNLSIPVLLSGKTSKRFFRLNCPQCGSLKVRAADFWFNQRKCRACRTAWRPA